MSRDPYAVWVPGPRWKVQTTRNLDLGAVGHSLVGYKGGVLPELNSPVNKAWHYTVMYDGLVWQHYEDEDFVWHGQGSSPYTIGIEHEGGYNPENEPLTPAQLEASVALVRRLAERHGFPVVRQLVVTDPFTPGLYEHNQFAQKPCPSGRIPWEAYPIPSSPPVQPGPYASLAYVGAGPNWWQHNYEFRVQTHQPSPNVQTVYLGRQGADEVYRLTVEDWPEGS